MKKKKISESRYYRRGYKYFLTNQSFLDSYDLDYSSMKKYLNATNEIPLAGRVSFSSGFNAARNEFWYKKLNIEQFKQEFVALCDKHSVIFNVHAEGGVELDKDGYSINF